jgi:hypothetical protein
MGFWNSTHVKHSRKKRLCEYCDEMIGIGDSYFRETGVFNGDFNDYAFCERCKSVWTEYVFGEESEFSRGDFNNYFLPAHPELRRCPSCGSTDTDFKGQTGKWLDAYICCECEARFDVNLSFEAIRDVLGVLE